MSDSIVNDIMNDLNRPEREKPQIEENKKIELHRHQEHRQPRHLHWEPVQKS